MSSDKYVPPYMRVPEGSRDEEQDPNKRGSFSRTDLMALTRSGEQDKYGGPTTFVALPASSEASSVVDASSVELLSSPEFTATYVAVLKLLAGKLGPFVEASVDTAQAVSAAQVPRWVEQSGVLFTRDEGIRRFQATQALEDWRGWFACLGSFAPVFHSEKPGVVSKHYKPETDQRAANLKRQRMAQVRTALTSVNPFNNQAAARFLIGVSSEERALALAADPADLELQPVIKVRPLPPIAARDAEYATNHAGAVLADKLRNGIPTVNELDRDFTRLLSQQFGLSRARAAVYAPQLVNVSLLAMHRAFQKADVNLAGSSLMHHRIDPNYVVQQFEQYLLSSIAMILETALIEARSTEPGSLEKASRIARDLVDHVLSVFRTD